MKTFEDITIVVQGPVQTLKGREQEAGITHKCLFSLRQHLPGARIILSTWPNQQLSGLDYDELVISEDPGPNIRNFHSDGRAQHYNNNRQIVSTLAGLKQVKTSYAIKLRSDNYLIGIRFIELQQHYPNRCGSHRLFHERVVVSNVFTRKYAKGFRVAYHLSDFFYFGLTEDLLAIWDLELLADASPMEAKNPRTSPKSFIIDCTQMLWIRALQKFDGSVRLTGLLDNDQKQRRKSDLYYANNLVIGAPDDIGLGLEKKFSGQARIARLKGRCAQWQLFDWEDLYKNYCDPTFVSGISSKKRWGYTLARVIYVLPSRVETYFKLAAKR